MNEEDRMYPLDGVQGYELEENVNDIWEKFLRRYYHSPPEDYLKPEIGRYEMVDGRRLDDGLQIVAGRRVLFPYCDIVFQRADVHVDKKKSPMIKKSPKIENVPTIAIAWIGDTYGYERRGRAVGRSHPYRNPESPDYRPRLDPKNPAYQELLDRGKDVDDDGNKNEYYLKTLDPDPEKRPSDEDLIAYRTNSFPIDTSYKPGVNDKFILHKDPNNQYYIPEADPDSDLYIFDVVPRLDAVPLFPSDREFTRTVKQQLDWHFVVRASGSQRKHTVCRQLASSLYGLLNHPVAVLELAGLGLNGFRCASPRLIPSHKNDRGPSAIYEERVMRVCAFAQFDR